MTSDKQTFHGEICNPFEVKYSSEKPPVYERCAKEFGVDWDKGVVITYGDTVHCKYELPDHLKIHEEVHVHQQMALGKEIWWERYFTDPLFRLTQEIEAYKEQIAFGYRTMNRGASRRLKAHILYDMVHTYGNMCSKEEAEVHLYGGN